MLIFFSNPEDLVMNPAAEYYNPNVYSHFVFEDSAFEKIHGGDISGYQRDYQHEGGRKLNHAVSDGLYTENPDHLGQPFYNRYDLCSHPLSDLVKSDSGQVFESLHFDI